MTLIEMARQGRSWLQETTWSYLFGVGYFLMALSALVSINSVRGGVRRQLTSLLLMAALGLLVAKLMAAGYGGAARFRAAGTLPEKLAALMPRLLVAQARMDRAHLAACIAWVCRRPQAPLAAGPRFTLTRRGSYSTLIVLGLLSTLVEIPLDTFIASLLIKDPAVQLRIHVVMGALAVYSLAWLLADRRLMQGSAHVLGPAALELKIAGRLDARIALAAIRSADALTEPVAAWRKRQGVPLQATQSGTPSPLDRPNVVLTLDPDAGVTLRRWQLDCAPPRYLFLYVDEPSQFVAALRTATSP
jgi:cytochrome c oxidase subunit IV